RSARRARCRDRWWVRQEYWSPYSCAGIPPPSLPHKGGGASRWLGLDRATDRIEHPPPRGEGWGGGRAMLGAHQTYPSCFFFSIEPDWSLSISRPSRSELREACISMMIAGRSVASERMAPVSG